MGWKPGVAWAGGLPKHCILEVTMGHLSQHQWIQAGQDLRCFTSWKGDIHEKLPKTRKWEMWRKGQILQYPFENSTNFVLNDLNGFWTGSRNFLCWPRRRKIPWSPGIRCAKSVSAKLLIHWILNIQVGLVWVKIRKSAQIAITETKMETQLPSQTWENSPQKPPLATLFHSSKLAFFGTLHIPKLPSLLINLISFTHHCLI